MLIFWGCPCGLRPWVGLFRSSLFARPCAFSLRSKAGSGLRPLLSIPQPAAALPPANCGCNLNPTAKWSCAARRYKLRAEENGPKRNKQLSGLALRSGWPEGPDQRQASPACRAEQTCEPRSIAPRRRRRRGSPKLVPMKRKQPTGTAEKRCFFLGQIDLRIYQALARAAIEANLSV